VRKDTSFMPGLFLGPGVVVVVVVVVVLLLLLLLTLTYQLL
jgi:hypothetical protein